MARSDPTLHTLHTPHNDVHTCRCERRVGRQRTLRPHTPHAHTLMFTPHSTLIPRPVMFTPSGVAGVNGVRRRRTAPTAPTARDRALLSLPKRNRYVTVYSDTRSTRELARWIPLFKRSPNPPCHTCAGVHGGSDDGGRSDRADRATAPPLSITPPFFLPSLTLTLHTPPPSIPPTQIRRERRIGRRRAIGPRRTRNCAAFVHHPIGRRADRTQVSRWLSVVGCRLLVVGCWWLVVGCRLLVVGWRRFFPVTPSGDAPIARK
jgi:hypothetical protein